MNNKIILGIIIFVVIVVVIIYVSTNSFSESYKSKANKCKNVVCSSDKKCVSTTGKCVSKCDGVVCTSDKKCVSTTGKCVSKCDGVVCTSDKKCVSTTGKCVSKCDGVVCSNTEFCEENTGYCVSKCDRVFCSDTEFCEENTGYCVSKCPENKCDNSQNCVSTTGECVDKCDGVVCLEDQKCINGICECTTDLFDLNNLNNSTWIMPNGGIFPSGNFVNPPKFNETFYLQKNVYPNQYSSPNTKMNYGLDNDTQQIYMSNVGLNNTRMTIYYNKFNIFEISYIFNVSFVCGKIKMDLLSLGIPNKDGSVSVMYFTDAEKAGGKLTYYATQA